MCTGVFVCTRQAYRWTLHVFHVINLAEYALRRNMSAMRLSDAHVSKRRFMYAYEGEEPFSGIWILNRAMVARHT